MAGIPDPLPLLSSHPVFHHLDAPDRELMARGCSTRHYAGTETVILYGEVWPYLFLVAGGSVDALKESGEGRNLMIKTFLTGDIFWGMAFFQPQAPMPVTLEAREPASLYLWSRETLMPILARNGRAAWELCSLMAARMQRASEILEGLAFQPVAGRLARLLLDQTASGRIGQQRRNLTLDEMAASIGSTREVVSRFLHRFSDEGMINITRTEFSITDLEKLRSVAQKVKG